MFNYLRFMLRGGNITFIAENIAAIYCSLKETQFGQSLSNAQLLYATALIDMIAYTSTKKIENTDIELAVLNAQIGEISIDFYSKKAYGLFDFVDNKELICLAMQLEAIIFCIDNPMVGYRNIIDMVYSKQELIEKVVNVVIANPTKSRIYQRVKANVESIIQRRQFQDDVLRFDDK